MNESSGADAGQPPRRQVLDLKGQIWEVRETTTSYDRRSSHALIFETPYVIRIVRKYPTDWSNKTDEELLEISEGT
jgi:hypothetical protein